MNTSTSAASREPCAVQVALENRTVRDPSASGGTCAAGGDACAQAVAKILGVEAAATEKRVALVKCCGTRSEAIRVGDYNGICDCSVAAMTAGGNKGCHLCEKNSGGKEANHFTFQGFLAKVNYENPPTGEQIVAKCPAKCISVDPHFESGK